MSRQKAEETIDRLKAWIAERERLNDYAKYRNGYQVNRVNLIVAGVLKRSQLSANGNPRLRKLLIDAEKRWYGEAEDVEAYKETNVANEESFKRNVEELRRLQKAVAQSQTELALLRSEVSFLRTENNRLRSELGVHTTREFEVVKNYGGLTGWD